MEHLNSNVSLLTTLQIRYEGKLAAISGEQRCIQLNNMIFKGLEDRNPPEDIEQSINPTDAESRRFFKNDISNIMLLTDNGELTENNIKSEIINLFEFQTQNDENDEKDENKEHSNCLFSIGLIADPQFADNQSRFNYAKTKIRRYRNSLNITKNAIKAWNENDKPLLVICLGDIIDGLNKKTKTSKKCIKNILCEFNKFDIRNPSELITNIMQHPLNEHCLEIDINDNEWIPKFPYFQNLIGNHELYNFNLQELMEYFYSPQSKENGINWDCSHCELTNSIKDKQCKACFIARDRFNNIMSPRFYYLYSPFPDYIFITLNCYELSILGYNYYDNYKDKVLDAMDASHFNLKEYVKLFDIKMNENDDDNKNKRMHPNKKIAMEMLSKHNNGNIGGIPYTLDDNQRWVHFNGGFGSTQLQWLEKQLIEIEKLDTMNNRKHNVILFGHIPIWCRFSDNKIGLRGNERTLCWDYKKINKIIGKYQCVKMYIAGHKHGGECIKDGNNIWHKTFEGAIEAPLNTNCFGTMYFYKNKAILKGYGINNAVFPFR